MSKLYEEFNKWWNSLDEETRWDIDKCSAMRGWSARQTHIKVDLPNIRRLEYNTNDNPYTNEVYLMEDDFYEVQELENALDEAGVRY